MKKRKFKIYLTPAESSIVIQNLNHLRNTMLRENRDTGCLDVPNGCVYFTSAYLQEYVAPIGQNLWKRKQPTEMCVTVKHSICKKQKVHLIGSSVKVARSD